MPHICEKRNFTKFEKQWYIVRMLDIRELNNTDVQHLVQKTILVQQFSCNVSHKIVTVPKLNISISENQKVSERVREIQDRMLPQRKCRQGVCAHSAYFSLSLQEKAANYFTSWWVDSIHWNYTKGAPWEMLPTERDEVGGHHHQISGTGHTQLLCVWQHPSNYKDSSSAAQKSLVSISL